MIILFQTITAETRCTCSWRNWISLFTSRLFVCLFVWNKSLPSQLNVAKTRQFPLRPNETCKFRLQNYFSVGNSCKVVNVSSCKHDKAESVRSFLCTAAPFYGPWVSLACCELNEQPICFWSGSDCEHFSRTVNPPPPRCTSTNNLSKLRLRRSLIEESGRSIPSPRGHDNCMTDVLHPSSGKGIKRTLP